MCASVRLYSIVRWGHFLCEIWVSLVRCIAGVVTWYVSISTELSLSESEHLLVTFLERIFIEQWVKEIEVLYIIYFVSQYQVETREKEKYYDISTHYLTYVYGFTSWFHMAHSLRITVLCMCILCTYYVHTFTYIRCYIRGTFRGSHNQLIRVSIPSLSCLLSFLIWNSLDFFVCL